MRDGDREIRRKILLRSRIEFVIKLEDQYIRTELVIKLEDQYIRTDLLRLCRGQFSLNLTS